MPPAVAATCGGKIEPIWRNTSRLLSLDHVLYILSKMEIGRISNGDLGSNPLDSTTTLAWVQRSGHFAPFSIVDRMSNRK